MGDKGMEKGGRAVDRAGAGKVGGVIQGFGKAAETVGSTFTKPGKEMKKKQVRNPELLECLV
jgi:hypothetical protein